MGKPQGMDQVAYDHFKHVLGMSDEEIQETKDKIDKGEKL